MICLCVNSLLIVDDLISQCSQSQRMSDLFTKGSHNKGISVMFLTQNLFPPQENNLELLD